MVNVLLLREPASGGQHDPYETAFDSLGYSAWSLAVLETAFTNVRELQDLLCNGPTPKDLQGIIITSARAATSLGNALKTALYSVPPDRPGIDKVQSDWTHVPFYVVGESTAAAIRDLQTSYPTILSHDILGSASGTSAQLAKFIVYHLGDSREGTRLLYLTGDKNRDTLPNILSTEGIELLSMQAYETRGSSDFPANLRRTINSVEPDPDHHWWITFFAPSAADFTMPFLRQHFHISDKDDTIDTGGDKIKGSIPVKLAAIGPTTADHLTNNLQVVVDAVAGKPSAVDLANRIAEADSCLGA